MSLLTRHFCAQFLIFVFMVLAFLVVLFGLSELLRALAYAERQAIPKELIGWFWVSSLTQLISALLPTAVFLGGSYLSVQLSYDHEFSILTASGLNRLGLLRHFLPAFLLLATLSGVIGFWAGPLLSRTTEERLLAHKTNGDLGSIPLKTLVPIGTDYVLYAEGRERRTGALLNVTLGAQTQAAHESNLQNLDILKARRLTSSRPKIGLQWELHDGDWVHIEPSHHDLIHFNQAILETPSSALSDLSHESLKTSDLLMKSASFREKRELHLRLNLPLSCFLLSILGILIGFLPPRTERARKILPVLLWLLFSAFSSKVASKFAESTHQLGLIYLTNFVLLLACGFYLFWSRYELFFRLLLGRLPILVRRL